MNPLLAMFTVVAFVVGVPMMAFPQTEGLVAYYSFEEGQGDVLTDRSGNGNDGQISKAQWAASPWGTCLSFNGTSSEVRIPASPSLQLQGDATFMARFRATALDGRDRIIFGDGAGLAINRNISVVIDRGLPAIAHGDGRDLETITLSSKLDSGWMHLAVIYEFPHYYVYLDGRLVDHGSMRVPLVATEGGPRFLGGWWAGYFKGEIDEVRLYNRAISDAELARYLWGDEPPPATELTVDPRYSYPSETLSADLLCRNLGVPRARVTVEVTGQGAPRPVLSGSAQVRLTRPTSGRGVTRVRLPAPHLAPGTYDVRAALQGPAEEVLVRGEVELTVINPPEWLRSTAGETGEVLPPFTPVQVARGPDDVSVSMWGRRYDFRQGAFVSQVRTRDAELLAGPMRLHARVGDAQVQWQGGPPTVELATDAQAVVSQAAGAGTLRVTAQTRVESDGLVKITWQLGGSEPVQLQGLTVDIPVKARHAKYLYMWPTQWGAQGFSGATPDHYVSAFKHIIWLGDEERGLSWYCESDEHWHIADPDRAFEVITEQQQVTLRLNLVDQPVHVTPDEPLSYVFGLQATPLRPIDRDCWDYRISGALEYGHDYDLLKMSEKGKRGLDFLRDKGCRTLLTGNWTQVITYPWPMGWEAEFQALVDGCHERGMKLIPYLGYQICEDAPEYPHLRDDVIRLPLAANPDRYPDMPVQMVNTVCLGSVWRDALVHYVAKMIERFGIDGVYLDSTLMPFGCTNEAHGCGYRRDGKVHPTYPIFAVRDTLKRLYAVVREHSPDGIVDAHVFDCMNGAALAYTTSYWTGEQLGHSDNEAEGLPLDRFRCEMMGVNWGVPAEFLHYRLGSFHAAHAISLLHDVPTRAWLGDHQLTASIWRLAEDYGRAQARFIPYWEADGPVTVTGPDCYASLYVHPHNGVLVLVANLGKDETRVSLSLDPGKLGLAGVPLTALDGLTREPVPLDSGRIEVPLPTMGWRYVWVKPTP